jgi:hypothetical protein
MTIARKNALFAGSHGGGRTWATIATLLAKMNRIDPHAWLAQTSNGSRRVADLSNRCSHALAKPERPQLGAYEPMLVVMRSLK